MEYRLFGRTGMRVSVIGLGCGGFGGVGSPKELFGKGEDEQAAFQLMDRALELGINYFDTANSYGGGASEEMIGSWLTARGVREQIVLSTKLFNAMSAEPNAVGLSRRAILREVEASLRRLKTDHLDIYMTHAPDWDTPVEETLRTMDDLVRSGKVRYIGCSNEPAWHVARGLWASDRLGLARWESVQNEYNLLHRGAEREVLLLCADQGLAFTPFSPLAGGWLTGKYRQGEPAPPGSRMTLRPEPYEEFSNQPTHEAIERLRKAAGERGVELAALALAWVIRSPQVTSALVGPRRLEHFEPALGALAIQLSAEERDALSGQSIA